MSKRTPLAALLVTIALIVAACDDRGDDTTADSGAELSGDPIKLFVLHSGGAQTGSDTGEVLQGA